MNQLTKKRFQTMDESGFQEAWQIYLNSFPFYEKRPIDVQNKLMKDQEYFCTAFYDQEALVGILFYFESKTIRYVEHLAINSVLRGKNYGSKIMSELIDTEKIVILEIDPPIDDISIRRQKFYENLGFHLNPYLLIHPSYTIEKHPHELKILTFPNLLTNEEHEQFLKYLHEKALFYVEK